MREMSDWGLSDELRDNWMQTASGRQFYIFRPTADMVHIEDIATHLGNLCRFTGAVKKFYSVAQHSVGVSYIVPPALALWGLLHDSSEAYINDINRPTKQGLPQYKDLETLIMQAVADRFDLEWPEPPPVKIADQVMLATEARDLMPNHTLWSLGYGEVEPLHGFTIDPQPPEEAAQMFLNRFFELTR